MHPSSTPQLTPTGAMLRAMREAVGLTLDQMATRTGATKSTLSRFERGERIISPELLARITRVLADETNARRRGAA